MSEKEIRSCWPEWQLQQRLFTGEFCTSYLAVQEGTNPPVTRMIQVVQLPPDNPELAEKQQQAVMELARAGISGDTLKAYFDRLRQNLEGELRQVCTINAAGIAPMEQVAFQQHPSGGWACWIRTELNMPISYYEGKHITGAEEAVRCGLDLCSALVHLEEIGGVHGELSHTTVVRSDKGDFRMTSYALRRVLEKTGHVFFPLRSSDFDAPEVRTGRKYSIAADLYSVGVIMGYLLCGGEMPDDTKLSQVAIQHRRLAAIIRKAMSPRVQDRYISAAEMLAVLREPGLAGDMPRFTEPSRVVGGAPAEIGAENILTANVPRTEPQGFWGKVMAFLAPIEAADDAAEDEEEALSEEEVPEVLPEEEMPVVPTAQVYDAPPVNEGVDAWASQWEAAEAMPAPAIGEAAAEMPVPLEDAVPVVQTAPVAPVPAADIPSDPETEADIGRMVSAIMEENAAPRGEETVYVPEELPFIPETAAEYVPEAPVFEAEPVFIPEEASAPAEEAPVIPEEAPEQVPAGEEASEGGIDSLLARGSVFDDAELQRILQDAQDTEAAAPADFAPAYQPEEMPETPETEETAPAQQKRFPLWILAIVAVALVAALVVLLKPWELIGNGDDAGNDNPITQNDDAADDAANSEAQDAQQNNDAGDQEPEGFFYLPDSDKQPVTQQELAELDRFESYMALNEIYARHGMIFQTESLQEYFESQAWYTGVTESSIEVYNSMSNVEKDNINAITEYQIQMGYTESQ